MMKNKTSQPIITTHCVRCGTGLKDKHVYCDADNNLLCLSCYYAYHKSGKAEILNRTIVLVEEKTHSIGAPENPREIQTLVLFNSEEQARDFFLKHPDIRANIKLFSFNNILDKTLPLPQDIESEE